MGDKTKDCRSPQTNPKQPPELTRGDPKGDPHVDQCLKIKIMTIGMMKVHSTEPKPVAMLTILGVIASGKWSNSLG